MISLTLNVAAFLFLAFIGIVGFVFVVWLWATFVNAVLPCPEDPPPVFSGPVFPRLVRGGEDPETTPFIDLVPPPAAGTR